MTREEVERAARAEKDPVKRKQIELALAFLNVSEGRALDYNSQRYKDVLRSFFGFDGIGF